MNTTSTTLNVTHQYTPITPSNTTDFASLTRAIYVGGTGNVAVVRFDGTVVTFSNVAAGSVLPVSARRVNSSGTTATGLCALFGRLERVPFWVPNSFSPLDLSPVLWLDASDTSTITESGGAVSQWDDKSGNGYNLTQATAARQPKSGTATLNSLNVIEYDNTTSFQHLVNLSIDVSGGTHTFFMVVDVAASDTDHALLASGEFFGGYAYLAQSGSTSTGINNWTSTSLHVDTVAFSGSTRDDVYQHVGTGPKLLRIVSQANVSGLTFGYGQNPFDWDYGSTLAEIIVVSGTLTAGQIADTEAYLADKWGITL